MNTVICIVTIVVILVAIRRLWADVKHQVRFHGHPALEQSDEWFEDHGHDGVTYHAPARCGSCGLSIELVSTDFALIQRCRSGLVRRCPMCSNYTLRNKIAEGKGLGHQKKSGLRCASC